jgi:hypothetical protein
MRRSSVDCDELHVELVNSWRAAWAAAQCHLKALKLKDLLRVRMTSGGHNVTRVTVWRGAHVDTLYSALCRPRGRKRSKSLISR